MTTNCMCRCCGNRRVNRPRGLCSGCYYQPELRAKYPPTSKYAGRAARGEKVPPDFDGDALTTKRPTVALPGTLAKVAVLEERALNGLDLWHEADAIGLPPDGTEKNCRWSPEEDQMIYELYPVLGPTLLAKRMGKAWRTLQHRAQLLGVKCKPGPKAS